jgi:hypothetical protein
MHPVGGAVLDGCGVGRSATRSLPLLGRRRLCLARFSPSLPRAGRARRHAACPSGAKPSALSRLACSSSQPPSWCPAPSRPGGSRRRGWEQAGCPCKPKSNRKPQFPGLSVHVGCLQRRSRRLELELAHHARQPPRNVRPQRAVCAAAARRRHGRLPIVAAPAAAATAATAAAWPRAAARATAVHRLHGCTAAPLPLPRMAAAAASSVCRPLTPRVCVGSAARAAPKRTGRRAPAGAGCGGWRAPPLLGPLGFPHLLLLLEAVLERGQQRVAPLVPLHHARRVLVARSAQRRELAAQQVRCTAAAARPRAATAARGARGAVGSGRHRAAPASSCAGAAARPDSSRRAGRDAPAAAGQQAATPVRGCRQPCRRCGCRRGGGAAARRQRRRRAADTPYAPHLAAQALQLGGLLRQLGAEARRSLMQRAFHARAPPLLLLCSSAKRGRLARGRGASRV